MTGRPDYVVINGQGRSGTNWLLELLDASAHTHCRNEPNELEGTALHALSSKPVASAADRAALEAGWDEAVRAASRKIGERDHRATVPKQHLRESARRAGLYRTAHSTRLREGLASLGATYAREWPIPALVADARALAAALPVLKMNGGPGWTSWLLESRPDIVFLHIARHPGGFLNSWYNRWLSFNDADAVSRANQARLRVIAAHDAGFAATMGDIDAMPVEESELWYWRYNIELTHLSGRERPQYRLILFERLAHESLELGQQIYRHCGLAWDDGVAALIAERTSRSESIAKAWREKLEPRQVEIVERVLDGSAMSVWW